MSTILKKDTQGGFYCKPRGTVQIESTQIRWFLEQLYRRLDLMRGSQRHSKLSSVGAIMLESTLMVLVMVMREAGPHERQPTMLKGELGNNFRKPRNIVGKLA
jgi:hypothetical protein